MRLLAIDESRGRANNARMTDEERRHIGRRLRSLPVERGLTQADVARDRRVRIAIGTLQSIEGGRRESRDSKLEKVARFFDVTVEQLRGPAETILPSDPRLIDLTDEALTIARAFLLASTAVRQRVHLLLTRGAQDRATRLAERLAALPEENLAGLEALLRAAEEQSRQLHGKSAKKHTSA